MLVVGLDGARGGWIAAYAEVGAGSRARVVDVHFTPDVSSALTSDLAVAAIDMPIGLPEVGPRTCDREARTLLRPHGSRVFAAPIRATLAHRDDYAAACATARAVSGRALSKQAWNLLPKIAEVDSLADDERIHECHPEVSFALMAGAAVSARKKSPDGAAQRRDLLRRAFDLGAAWTPPRLAGAPDDILDALACAWSAVRIASAHGLTLGLVDGVTPRDALGRPMRICA